MIITIKATRDLNGIRFNTKAGEEKTIRYFDKSIRSVQDIINGRPIDWGGSITRDYEIVYQSL